MTSVNIAKHYADVASGQIHYRIANPSASMRPLMCLHPAPSSGLYFETVMPLLATDRTVICPDYPGYGGSDALGAQPSISDYADAMLQLSDALQFARPIDVMGFHTGCLVGAEMALQLPEKIGKLVLCDVPYFSAEKRRELAESSAKPLALSENLECMDTAWRFNVTNRSGDAPLERGLALFAEQLRSGTQDHYAFRAAFSYDCEQRLSELSAGPGIIATSSGLRAATLAAVENIPNARLIDAAEISGKVFESNADAIAKHILSCLSHNHG